MSNSFIGLDTTGSKDKKPKQLDKLDKVYSEMKSKNKKLKKEKESLKVENETLRSIFAEFQVEFKQDRKHEKDFHQLTIAEIQDVFAILQKLMAQTQSMNIGHNDLQNENWAEFDLMEQQPAKIQATKK